MTDEPRLSRRRLLEASGTLAAAGVLSTTAPALARGRVAESQRPLVVAGHSYGGAVIPRATAAATIVKALAFDDHGNATMKESAFPTVFTRDVPRGRARVLEAVQKPINGAALQEKAGPPLLSHPGQTAGLVKQAAR